MVGGDLVGLLVVCGDCWGNTNCLFYFFLTNAFCRVLATMQSLKMQFFGNSDIFWWNFFFIFHLLVLLIV